MNDSEIIKALECCTTTKGGCKECPMKGYKKVDCQLITATEAYKLINRQQAEIDRLNIELKTMRGAANSWKAEVQRLKGAVQEWVDGKCLSQKHLLMIGKLQNEIETAKSEAVRKFAERLKECAFEFPTTITFGFGTEWVKEAVSVIEIDNLVKEMGYNDG